MHYKKYKNIKIYQAAKMNPDYSSDIRQVERLIFDNNIYLLTMFDKKIPSFSNSINWENKDNRKQNRETNLHASTIIDCDNFRQDIIKNLSRDLTKPIWNCVTRVDPKIIYAKESAMQPIEIITIVNKLLNLFCGRLKNEHEDQSNMKINLQAIEYDQEEQDLRENFQYQSIQDITSQLFKILSNLVDRQSMRMEQGSEYDGMNEERQYAGYEKCMLIAAKELLTQYIEKRDENYNNQLDIFNKIATSSINDMINCKIGSLALCLMPKLLTLPLLIHPMLIPIHTIIKLQMEELVKKQEYKNKLGGYVGKDKNKSTSDPIFGQISKSQSISKIVFVNLDGYESEFNVDVAKYLCKNLMYISFPKESIAQYEGIDTDYQIDSNTEEMEEMQDTKSERLLKKYYMGTLQDDEKKELLQYYKLPEKQTKKNLFIFPLHSRALAKVNKLPSLYNNQTTFISFIMNELMYNQILQFNPSLIVVSYSQKIFVDNDYFTELMKELTITGNYKVMFFANLSKNYVFEEFYDESMGGTPYKEMEEKYYQKYEQSMKVVEDNSLSTNVTMNMGGMYMGDIGKINTDMLEKISIMVKVTSGTFSLNHYKEPDCYLEKYKNYKTISYAGPLVQKLSEQCQNLTKLKLRFIDYNSYCKILHNYFNNRSDTFDKLFAKVVHKYYINLIKEIEKIILNQLGKEKSKVNSDMNNSARFGPEEEKRRQQLEREEEKIKTYIESKYNYIEIKENWNNLKFQKLLEISTEKVQSKYFVHLPKYREKKNTTSTVKKEAQNLICLQFYTVLEKEKIPVELSPSSSKVLYSSTRRHKNSYIYITNHLIKQSSTSYSHLCGVITEQFDTKVSPRVLLYPVTFNGGAVLTQFQTYTEFNYFETNNYIFMFWPKIYSTKLQLLSRLCNMKYSPQTTYLFFCANRRSPDVFNMVYNGSQQQNIIPRSGCQCYEVENTNKIYIFGGFYSDQANYLLFQTNITKVTYQPSQTELVPRIQVENIPKKFYFDYEEMERNREIKVITNIKNDMVRPRIQYEFLEQQKIGDDRNDQKVVFLVGGVGQKFVRPYSMIGHMAHKVVFNGKTGELQNIKRIHMNNILPINTHAPIKMRGPMQSKILSHAENRSINFITGECAPNSFSIFHNHITYNPENQRFEYEPQYEFCDSELKNHREQIALLKKHVNEGKQKLGMFAKCPRGKEYNPNYITLNSETNTKFIIELQLSLSLDVRYMYEQLPPAVRLTGSSILSIDINGGIIYALIKHEIYTLNNCILAYFDLNELSPKLKQNKPIQIQLKQLHKFDQNVSYDVLIAVNTNTILLLHGQRFDKGVDVPELMLRRNRKKHIKIDKILSNQFYSTVNTSNSNKKNNEMSVQGGLFQQFGNINCSNGINTSVFINKNNGVILCLSFKTIERALDEQVLYFSLEKLEINTEKYAWQLMKERKYKIIIDPSIHQGSKVKSKRRENIKILEILDKKQSSGSGSSQIDNSSKRNEYWIIGYIREQILVAEFDLEDTSGIIKFMNKNKTLNEYLKEASTSTEKQQSVLLQKSLEDYNELRLTQSSSIGSKFGLSDQMDLE